LEADAAGRVAFDQVDKFPGDDTGAEATGDAVDRILGEAFEEAADRSTHAHLDLGDAERESGSSLFTVLPDEVYVVDADDFMAVDVDDLLIEQVTLEEEISFILGQGGRVGGVAELHGATRG